MRLAASLLHPLAVALVLCAVGPAAGCDGEAPDDESAAGQGTAESGGGGQDDPELPDPDAEAPTESERSNAEAEIAEAQAGRVQASFVWRGCLKAVRLASSGGDLTVAKAMTINAIREAGDDPNLQVLAYTATATVMWFKEGPAAALRQLELARDRIGEEGVQPELLQSLALAYRMHGRLDDAAAVLESLDKKAPELAKETVESVGGWESFGLKAEDARQGDTAAQRADPFGPQVGQRWWLWKETERRQERMADLRERYGDPNWLPKRKRAGVPVREYLFDIE